MAQQTINTGSAANDGTGDPLRTAFIKSNGNFTELYGADTLKADKTYVDTQDGLKVAKAGDTMTGALFVNDATASASPTTGALTVAGGLGVGGAVNAGGNLTISGTTFQTATGLLLVQSPDNSLYLRSAASPSSVNINDAGTGDVTLARGGGTITTGKAGGGSFRILTDTASTSPTTGALTVAGGLGVSGRFTVGGNPISPTTVVEAIGYLGGSSQYGTSFRPVTDNTTPIIFNNAAGTAVGTINTTPSATSYVTSSDGRLKENLRPPVDAGRVIDTTNVYHFSWKADGTDGYGVIAQEANGVYPEAVTHDEKLDWWGTDYSKYVPLLLAELKALRARVAQLESLVNPI